MQPLSSPLLSASSAHPSKERAAAFPSLEPAQNVDRWKLPGDTGVWAVSPSHGVGCLEPVTCLAGSECKLAVADRGETFSHTGCCPEFFSPSLISAVITFLCKKEHLVVSRIFPPSPLAGRIAGSFPKALVPHLLPLEDIHPWIRVLLLPHHP